jgi:hypothetical protein
MIIVCKLLTYENESVISELFVNIILITRAVEKAPSIELIKVSLNGLILKGMPCFETLNKLP